MSFRTFLPALALLCLFCSSAQAQTLDDTLLTVTVFFEGTSYYDPNVGNVSVPDVQFSITSFGLPLRASLDLDGMIAGVSLSSSGGTVGATSFQNNPEFPFPIVDYEGRTGPITVPGTYLMDTMMETFYGTCDECPQNQSIAFGTGEITVAVATPAPTPEPISGSLTAIGFAMLALRRHLGRKRGR